MKALIRGFALFFICVGFALARVNVNTATQPELESLPEVGPVKAKAILDYRKKNGPFKALEDLEKVPGVGPATIKALKNEVSFSGVSTPPAKPDDKAKPVKSNDAAKAPDAKPNGAAVRALAKPETNKAIANDKSAGRAQADDKAKAKSIAVDGADKNKGKGNDKMPAASAAPPKSKPADKVKPQ